MTHILTNFAPYDYVHIHSFELTFTVFDNRRNGRPQPPRRLLILTLTLAPNPTYSLSIRVRGSVYGVFLANGASQLTLNALRAPSAAKLSQITVKRHLSPRAPRDISRRDCT